MDRNLDWALLSSISSSDEFIKSLIDGVLAGITKYYKFRLDIKIQPKKIKQQTSEFKVGDFVSCISNTRIKINYYEYDELRWNKYKKSQPNRWHTTLYHKRRKFALFNFSFYIKKQDIRKAKVVKVNNSSIQVKLIILDNLDKLKMSLLEKKEIIINLNMTIQPEIELIQEELI